MNLKQLWLKRAKSFWIKTAPYFRYALMGGLTTTFVIFLIAGMYGYAMLLKSFPADFPYLWIMTPVLAWLVFSGKVRTYLQKPDLVYLLPLEARMSEYFRPAIRFAYIMHAVMMIFAAAVILPLHAAGSIAAGQTITPAELALIAAVLLVLKWASMHLYWKEAQLREQAHRTAFRVMRLFMMTSAIYLLLAVHTAAAVLTAALMLLFYMALLSKAPAFTLNWDHMIVSEENAHRRVYQFLSWFIDVPETTGEVKRRKYIRFLERLIPFHRNHTYTFLYWKSFQRSETFGIILRIMLIGYICVFVFSHPYWKLAAFAFFAFLTAAQVSAIFAFHKHLVWLQVYPLPESVRHASAARLAAYIYAMPVLVLIFPVIYQQSLTWPVLLLIAILTWIFGSMHFRKKSKNTMDSHA